MTEQEVLEVARKQIRAENAAYMREWRKRTERQADKKEQTIVKVGNRTINDAVTTQKEANGFSFTE